MFLAFCLGVLALVASPAFARIVAIETRTVLKRRWIAILIAALFPFAVLAFIGTDLYAYGYLCEVNHWDFAFSDYWKAPLRNGYYLSAVDDFDHPFIESLEQPELFEFADLKALEVHRSIVLGKAESETNERKPFFLLNTLTHRSDTFSTRPELERAASAAGISKIDLQRPEKVYADHSSGSGQLAHALFVLCAIGIPFWTGKFSRKKMLSLPRAAPSNVVS